jgi:hypothetical protein
MKKVRVGSGSSGWPDFKDGAVDVAMNGDIDYMSFDHLAELTMAILQSQRAKDPSRGYIPEVLPLMRALLPVWKEKDKHFRMANNGGGANPGQCAEEVLKIVQELNLGGIKIGVVTGDDIPLSRIDELRAQGLKFKNLDTGEEDIDRVREKLLGAYAYTGADKIIEAYDAGANLVLTGRAADNALYCGNFMHPLGWKYEDEYWDRIGSAIITGHLLECSSWSAGTCSNLWEEIEYPRGNPGFPIAEMDENGDTIITKTPNSGGAIRVLTLKEHLVYEVHDPHNYIMPDGIADITAVKLEQVGKDRVKISKFGDAPRGKRRPDTLKLCLAYNEGFISEELTVISGPKVFKMAEKMKDFVYKRLDYLNLHPKEVLISLIGYDSLQGPTVPPPDLDHEPPELGFRIAFKCDTREEARTCRTECGHLAWAASGPGTGFTQPPAIRPVFALWPTLIPREAVPEKLEIKEVK